MIAMGRRSAAEIKMVKPCFKGEIYISCAFIERKMA